MPLKKLLKKKRLGLGLLGAIVGVVLLFCFTPLRALFDQAFLIMLLHQLGALSVPLFLGVYTIATVLGVPGTVLTIAGGAVFGLFWGTVWSVIGATLGAIGAFMVVRYLLYAWAERHFGHHPMLIQCKQAIRQNPLRCVLAVRFAHVIPFNLTNFLFGLTPVGLKPYTIGTFVGIIPGSLAYTWLGVAGMQAFEGGDRLPLFLALGLLTLISALPLLFKK